MLLVYETNRKYPAKRVEVPTHNPLVGSSTSGDQGNNEAGDHSWKPYYGRKP